MQPSQTISYLFIGGIVGIASSAIGALIDYLISRRKTYSGNNRLPGCMMLVTGGLGFTELVVTIISFLLIHSLRPAILAGVGVLLGFTITFIFLTLLWLLFSKRETRKKIEFKATD